ncbi:hypothetical protein CBR_g29940 [Chara braunii]|uniref:Uncharacterized protein n=1 Tax=Chara braunii TaxID=69332 RepID=A0A388LBH3_CHABU|nr:hypothetical protein CBR_g29940 [Chara braunii]|eukprot:GBG79675.1 hypothetical protein CBR_g29940 [Chara braunii]
MGISASRGGYLLMDSSQNDSTWDGKSAEKFEGPAVGIDLGTTNSCVGVWHDGHVAIIPNDYGKSTTPSCVAFTEDGRILVGDSAKDQVAGNAANTLFQVKRWIGRRFEDLCKYAAAPLWPYSLTMAAADPDDATGGGGSGGGDGVGCLIELWQQNKKKTYAPEEISAMILSKMKEIAQAHLKCSVSSAVVAVPANFTQAQKLATKDSARLAGFECVRLITEPSAAALAYAVRTSGSSAIASDYCEGGGGLVGGLVRRKGRLRIRNLDDNGALSKTVMVVDWGGGTFDVSVMRMGNREFRVIAVAGDTQLGGQDIDDLMVAHFAEEFRRVRGFSVQEDAEAMQRIRSRCEAMKHTLSAATCADAMLEGLCGIGGSFEMKMTRAELEEMSMPVLDKCMNLVDRALKDAGVRKTDIAKVILAGGSMRMPKIQELLSTFFAHKTLCKVIHPDECVAYGAAVQAALITGDIVMDVKDLTLVEAVPVTIGFGQESEKYVRVIERNTPYPTRVVRKNWQTTYDGAKSCHLFVYEGEREKANENNLLGKLFLSGLQPGPPGSGRERVALEAILEIDDDGILTATFRTRTRRRRIQSQSSGDGGGDGQHRSSERSITKSFGRKWGTFGAAEAQAVMREAMQCAEDDRADVAKTTARCRLLQYVYRTRWRLSLITDPKRRDRLRELLDVEESWWEVNKDTLLEVAEYSERRKRLEKACGRF